MQEVKDKSYLLIGVWKLINITNRDADGNILRSSYGPKKMGIITFNDDQRMMVVIQDGREHPTSTVRPREYSSYCGTYRFDGTTLVTKVDGSTIPERVGTDQTRPAVLDGNRVTLTAPPAEFDGVMNYRELTWEKVH